MDKKLFSDAVSLAIEQALSARDHPDLGCFEAVLGMGELIDRLTIVNIKLYELKDKVMQSEDQKFKAWAAERDVELCRLRALLKKCIDLKLIGMILDPAAPILDESKHYG
jgi:hypothetical protein